MHLVKGPSITTCFSCKLPTQQMFSDKLAFDDHNKSLSTYKIAACMQNRSSQLQHHLAAVDPSLIYQAGR